MLDSLNPRAVNLTFRLVGMSSKGWHHSCFVPVFFSNFSSTFDDDKLIDNTENVKLKPTHFSSTNLNYYVKKQKSNLRISRDLNLQFQKQYWLRSGT